MHGFEGRSSGTVTLRAEAGGHDDVVLTIADNGVGISGANMRHIYNPFFTTKIGAGGSGLGLHIVHNIVTGVLGGHIDASSDGLSGTCVTLTLPLCAPPLPVSATVVK
jgi:signal transduction histidine kinase